jgi:hypothetical protein
MVGDSFRLERQEGPDMDGPTPPIFILKWPLSWVKQEGSLINYQTALFFLLLIIFCGIILQIKPR